MKWFICKSREQIIRDRIDINTKLWNDLFIACIREDDEESREILSFHTNATARCIRRLSTLLKKKQTES